MKYKTVNQYSQAFGQKLYEETPKAVFAAIAFSFCSNGGEESNQEAISRFIQEWHVLHQNKIIPQKPKS